MLDKKEKTIYARLYDVNGGDYEDFIKTTLTKSEVEDALNDEELTDEGFSTDEKLNEYCKKLGKSWQYIHLVNIAG